jgi:GH25 family lysozyme M1 (1,4-beta-N-acetylmuramidase)/LysM repeat protein
MQSLFGIDVSSYQGTINWDKVKSHIDFAILRVGVGSNNASQDDSKFKRNADECTRLGIPFGVYLYSYATTVDKAKSEAEHVLRLISGYKVPYKVWYDLEDSGTTQKCSAKLIGDMAEAFCTAIKNKGYEVGIYANKYWFTSILTDPRFAYYPKWVAQYYNECTYQGKYVAWQYTSTGKIDGINTNVDCNRWYGEEVSTPANPVISVDTLPNLSGYVGTSIAGALNSRGYDSTFAYRQKLATKLGISNYTGTAEQNKLMITKLGGSLPESNTNTYTVKKGDTLSGIAKAYSTTVSAIQTANSIKDANKISVGQVLKIPTSTTTTSTTSTTKTYTVKSGDTLSSIAKEYNTTVAAITKANGITNANKIYVGQVLKL